MEKQQTLFSCGCGSNFSVKNTKNPNKTKASGHQETEGGVSTTGLLKLFDEHPSWVKKPKTISSFVASSKPGRILKELRLFRDNRVTNNSITLSSEDFQEERFSDVSTQRSLLHKDLFKIKNIATSDVGQLSRLIMKKQQNFCAAGSCLGTKKIMNPKKRKERDQEEAEHSEVSTGLLPLFIEYPSCCIKKPKITNKICSVAASSPRKIVLQELKLSEGIGVMTKNSKDNYSSAFGQIGIASTKESGRERVVACNIERMKKRSLEDVREEMSHCVSTELSLYHHDLSKIRKIDDPFEIKKKMTPSDLGQLTRLLISSDLVVKHVLPFLKEDEIKQLDENGLRVQIFDVDTATKHELIFKRWVTSRSYVFIEQWKPEFVSRRGLKEGDEIGMYWNVHCSRFNFSVLNRAPATAAATNQVQQEA